MKFMQSKLFFTKLTVAALVLISFGIASSVAQSKTSKANSAKSNAQPETAMGGKTAVGSGGSDVARGKYIVEGVALCGQCHTPTDSEGNPDRRRWLQGGSVPWQSSRPNADWPQMVPRIGGIPPAPDEDMVKLLTTGIWTTGARLRSPMPQFRMNVSDAQAVVAYLKSLTPGQ